MLKSWKWRVGGRERSSITSIGLEGGCREGKAAKLEVRGSWCRWRDRHPSLWEVSQAEPEGPRGAPEPLGLTSRTVGSPRVGSRRDMGFITQGSGRALGWGGGEARQLLPVCLGEVTRRDCEDAERWAELGKA